MSNFASDFRAFLIANGPLSALVSTRVHVGSVLQPTAAPYVWIGRRGVFHERTLNQAVGEQPFEERWDLEVWGDIGDVQDIAEVVRNLDCAKGSFGSGTVQLFQVEDHSDDYVPKGVFSDEGFDLAAFQITVFGYVAGSSSSSSSSA
jgi:hypothetical protein